MRRFLRRILGRAERRDGAVPAPVVPVPEPTNVATMKHYATLSRAAGVDRLYLILTFDCDTDLDIEAAPLLDQALRRRGIKAGYAVPGAQLEKAIPVWRSIHAAGAEFLNHGARAHAAFRDGRYWPITFYDQMTEAEVVADIRRADAILREQIDARPEGFRAPHFGSFQSPEQLAVLYRTLAPMGYRYCSTTIPAVALARGPVVAEDGIAELPTMGSYRYPPTLLDSWTYLTDRTHYALGDEYFELFAETIREMVDRGLPGLLTYYADPSHVLGQQPFERALDVIARYDIPTLHGKDAVRRFKALN